MQNVNTTGYTGDVSIIGLPFTSSGAKAMLGVGSYSRVTWGGQLVALVNKNTSTVTFNSIASNAAWTAATHSGGGGAYLWVSGTYQTDA